MDVNELSPNEFTAYCNGLEEAKRIAKRVADYKFECDNAIGEVTATAVMMEIDEAIYLANLDYDFAENGHG